MNQAMTTEQAIGLAVQRHRAGRTAEAEAICRGILQRLPDHPAALHLLGVLLGQTGRLDEAVQILRRVIHLQPGSAEAQYNLGFALKASGLAEEAIAAFGRAMELNPSHAEAHNQLGLALCGKRCFEEARASYRRAIELKADFVPAHWNYALLLLLLGEFEEGWKEFEWRLKMPRKKLERVFPQPRWTGQDPRGKTILLFAEGGFGDAMQFIRYAPMVAGRGATVLLECQPELVPLLNRVEGISAVFSRGERLAAFDWQTPLQSLPLVFGTTIKTIPADVPYLSAPPQRIEQCAKRLAGDSSFKVGLAWAGSAGGDARSRSLATFAPLAAIPGVTFYGLQKGPEANQPVPPGLRLIQLGDELADFADTAALVSNLDLVISVDTSVAHLAGGLGRPVWTLIPHDPDFRWLLDRTDSPWYPTMRLFRQPAGGQWGLAVESIAAALAKHVSPSR